MDLVIQFVTFLGWWKRDPFKGLSDLQLGDKKVTLNHLVNGFFGAFSFFYSFSLFSLESFSQQYVFTCNLCKECSRRVLSPGLVREEGEVAFCHKFLMSVGLVARDTLVLKSRFLTPFCRYKTPLVRNLSNNSSVGARICFVPEHFAILTPWCPISGDHKRFFFWYYPP